MKNYVTRDSLLTCFVVPQKFQHTKRLDVSLHIVDAWNSTLEALSLGVPMVALTQWSDQSTNAKYVMDYWGIGVKALADEKRIVR